MNKFSDVFQGIEMHKGISPSRLFRRIVKDKGQITSQSSVLDFSDFKMT